MGVRWGRRGEGVGQRHSNAMLSNMAKTAVEVLVVVMAVAVTVMTVKMAVGAVVVVMMMVAVAMMMLVLVLAHKTHRAGGKKQNRTR